MSLSYSAENEDVKKEMFVLASSLQTDNLIPLIQTAGCYCECDGKILFLKRHPNRSYANKWGIPGGKLEPEETPLKGVIREVYEETGILLNQNNVFYINPPLFALNTLDEKDFIFHRFWTKLPFFPLLLLNQEEHTEAKWLTTAEALKDLPLMAGGQEALIEYSQYRVLNSREN